jgi:hypothetical protein
MFWVNAFWEYITVNNDPSQILLSPILIRIKFEMNARREYILTERAWVRIPLRTLTVRIAQSVEHSDNPLFKFCHLKINHKFGTNAGRKYIV